MNRRMFLRALRTSAAVAATVTVFAVGSASAEALRDDWCKDVKIRFFVGGAEGDGFGVIVYNGAVQAAHDTGAQVEYVFSGWNAEKMVQQLREAIAAAPDGIAMMGHPGDAPILPLAEEASKAGIKMMYQNVDVPEVRKQFGGGYVGAQLEPQGYALGAEAVRRFGLKAGDTAIVAANLDDTNRAVREAATMKAFEDAGLTVIHLQSPVEWAADPNLGIPAFTAAIQANPDVKIIAYPGGQLLGTAPTYMEAAGKKPGEIVNIGFAPIDGAGNVLSWRSPEPPARPAAGASTRTTSRSPEGNAERRINMSMRRRNEARFDRILPAMIALAIAATATAQEPKQAEPGPERWEGAIAAFESQDREHAPRGGRSCSWAVRASGSGTWSRPSPAWSP